MKKSTRIIVVLTVFSLGCVGKRLHSEALPFEDLGFGDFPGVKLVRVYDGDTFFVDIDELHPLLGDEIGIRVRGIDTPEIRGRCDWEKQMAHKARRVAEDTLVNAKRIDLMNVERGKYFRIVADVIVDGVDLAELLINAALAVPYEGRGPRHDWCE